MKSSKKSKRYFNDDSFLEEAVNELLNKYKCHTVLLYGSHARGDATDKSDYDLLGVRKSGKNVRLAEKRNGTFLDVFISPEKDLKKIGEEHLYMKEAKVLVESGNFGSQFIRKLKTVAKKPYQPLPPDEIQTRRVWAHKMLERIEVGDIEANYRRSWLHEALLADYFALRKKRYGGSKESFAWLKKNDLPTYKLFENVLKKPTDLKLLKKLVERVTELKLSS
ncbi:MAG: nucleotidyltransferase domain-containing protein [Bdellovibrio sp.]|nr:nucleotidyltransferase domain-containing protein [Bdellovibrio sp.]